MNEIDLLPIIDIVKKNTNFRHVIQTIPDGIQVVAMSINNCINVEKHDSDQLFFVVQGSIEVYTLCNHCLKWKKTRVNANESTKVIRNTWHIVKNLNTCNTVKLYTIYSKPVHREGEIEKQEPCCNNDTMLVLNKM